MAACRGLSGLFPFGLSTPLRGVDEAGTSARPGGDLADDGIWAGMAKVACADSASVFGAGEGEGTDSMRDWLPDKSLSAELKIALTGLLVGSSILAVLGVDGRSSSELRGLRFPRRRTLSLKPSKEKEGLLGREDFSTIWGLGPDIVKVRIF